MIDINKFTIEELEQLIRESHAIRSRFNFLKKNEEIKFAESFNIDDCFYDESKNLLYKITKIDFSHDDGVMVWYDYIEHSEKQMFNVRDCHDFISDLKFETMKKIPTHVFDDMYNLCDEYFEKCSDMHEKLFIGCEALIENYKK